MDNQNTVDEDILYILENDDIWFKSTLYGSENKKFKNQGLVNYIRLYRFIPDGITVIRKRRKDMATKAKIVKKVTKKAPAKKAVKAKKATAKK